MTKLLQGHRRIHNSQTRRLRALALELAFWASLDAPDPLALAGRYDQSATEDDLQAALGLAIARERAALRDDPRHAVEHLIVRDRLVACRRAARPRVAA